MSRESDELGEEQFWEMFAPDLSSEPAMFTPEELAEANAELERRIKEPLQYGEAPF